MRKRFLAILLVVVMLFTTTVCAAVQADYSVPSLTFNGTTANCEIKVIGETVSDEIEVTLSLWRGNYLIDSWSEEGTGYLRISETVQVTRGYTYRMEAEVTINGVELDPMSISKTCT